MIERTRAEVARDERVADARTDAASWLRGIADDIITVADNLEVGFHGGTVREVCDSLWASVGETWGRMDRKLAKDYPEDTRTEAEKRADHGRKEDAK